MSTSQSTTTTTQVTITLAPVNGRVEVRIGTDLLTTVKDGNNLVKRADAALQARSIYRESGYSAGAVGLVATGYDLS